MSDSHNAGRVRWSRALALATQRHDLVAQPFDLVGHAHQPVSGAGYVRLHLGHHFTMTPSQRTSSVGALLVVHG